MEKYFISQQGFCTDYKKEVLSMKYLKQFIIILTISFAGEILKSIIPLPVPASIYGMVLMFAGLLCGIIRLDQVKETGKFLIEIMPVMFIPAGVGLVSSYDMLRPILLPVSVITVLTIVTVMAATGHVSQFIIRHDTKKKNEGKEYFKK